MVEKYLSETDIKKLLECSRCKRVPNSPPIYMCRTGHHECSSCFGKHSDTVLVEETDGSTDTESESGSGRKGENRIGVIFPKASTRNPIKHVCAVCKDEVTQTRNLFAECLLNQLHPSKSENRSDKSSYIPSMKINVQETKVQTNYVDCCYNIYGSPCQRYDAPNVPAAAYDPQGYHRYPLPEYNYPMDPYVVTEPPPQLEYADPNVYYPDYDGMAYYCFNRRDVNDRRSKLNSATQGSVVSLTGESSKRPIRCPTHLCGRNIAVAALSSHFCFDHPEVPPLNVDFDVTCHLFIDPEVIPFNYGRCVAMLLIPNKCEAISSVSHPSIISANKIKNSLPLVVMASKLDCSTSGQPSIAGIREESQSEALNHGDFQSKAASQNTSKVFEQGDCLVIHSGILENIVGDKGGFDLHVMVH